MRTLYFITLVFLLTACASQPLYSPATGPNQPGYNETRLGDNRYRVGFTGRNGTSSDEVKNYALLRAAELTAANNYDWFSIVARDSDKPDTRKEPRVTIGVGVGSGCRPYGCPVLGSRWYTGAHIDNYYDRDRHHISLEIFMGKDKPDSPEEAYDADELLKYLRKSADVSF